MKFNPSDLLIFAYLIPLLIVWIMIYRRRRDKENRAKTLLTKNQEAGLTEPASLHPLIDKSLCIGCASCVDACPEQTVLGIIHGKGELVDPTHCIGHGACKAACPVDAITLVFGTEKRGLDIPFVDEYFQTNVPGIYIAGELGGMGLIRNAITQGSQAIDAIARLKNPNKGIFDVVIIGAGPAGFAATLAATKTGLRHVTLEQESFGGTVAHYPRGKIVMTQAVNMPMVGKVNMGQTTKEKLLEFWYKVLQKTQIKIQYQERMEAILPNEHGFVVQTNKASYPTKSVLLCIGRRGTPRKLGVPGEELTKVVYRLVDPEQYRGQKVLIVGGGNSALEAAVSIAEEPNTQVTLSYRSTAFSRAAQENREKVERAQAMGQLQVILRSEVKEIRPQSVILDRLGKLTEIPNDAIIISAGGVLPTPFLKKLGIMVETKHGTV